MGWATAQDIHLVTTIGVPTHRDGNVLDLVWSNTTAEATVSSKYNSTSDHKTIVGSTLMTKVLETSGITPELRVRDLDLENFSQCVKAWVKPGPIINVIDIEN